MHIFFKNKISRAFERRWAVFAGIITGLVIMILAGLTAGCIKKTPDATKNAAQPKTNSVKTQQQTMNEVKSTGRKTAFVSRVIDGDTIEVLIGDVKEKVRLLGINAPESVDPQRPVECFGIEASRQLHLLLSNKEVWLATDHYAPNRDKYDRLLRYVYDKNGQMINVEMVKQGYAFAYTPAALEYFSEFRYYEKLAREAGIGLWNRAVCPYNR